MRATQQHQNNRSHCLFCSPSFVYTIQSDFFHNAERLTSSRQKPMFRRYCSRSSLLMSEMVHRDLSIGHSCNMCSAVWTEPHSDSHWLDLARSIFAMFALKWPTPVRSRFSCTQAFLGYWYPSGFGVSSLMYSFRDEGLGRIRGGNGGNCCGLPAARGPSDGIYLFPIKYSFEKILWFRSSARIKLYIIFLMLI